MNNDSILSLLVRLAFVWLTLLTGIGFLRQRNRLRLDVTLMFASLGLPVIIQATAQTVGMDMQLPNTLASLLLVAQPYLLLRLLWHFRPVPTWVRAGALIGVVTSWMLMVFHGPPLPRFFAVILVFYFIILNGSAAMIFIRHAFTAAGVLRRRLRFAAIGSACLGPALFILGVGVFEPQMGYLSLTIAELSVLGSALNYYVAFLPPRWLLQAWQMIEVRNFLDKTTSQTQRPNTEEIFDHLCQTAVYSLGAIAARISRWEEATGRPTLSIPNPDGTSTQVYLDSTGIVGEAWRSGPPLIVRRSPQLTTGQAVLFDHFGAETVFVVPIEKGDRHWGILLVFLQHGSLFAQDDLSLLKLLADHSAFILEYARLLDESRRYTIQLEQEVERRTAALHESESRYRLLVEAAPETIGVHMDGKVVFVNPAGVRLLGASSADELIGYDVMKLVHPDSLELVGERRRLIESGTPLLPTAEEKFITLDGRTIDVDIVSVQTVYNGKPAVQVIVRDISERKRIEAELRASEERFRSTFEQAAVGLAHVELDGRYLRVNQRYCTIVGYSHAEMLTMRYQDLTYAEDLASDVALADAMLAGQIHHYNLEMRLVHKDGRLIWVNLTASLVHDDDGRPKYFISVIEDISARKQIEEELRRLNAELEQRVAERTSHLTVVIHELEAFSYSVSHDLRSPLRAIDGFSQVLASNYAEQLDETGKHYLQRVRAASQRMGLMIDGLLQLSRITRADMQPTEVNLSAIAEQVLADLRAADPSRKINTIIHPDLIAEGDERLLYVMLSNLLDNAWKFTAKTESPSIEFGALGEEEQRTYFIADNGAGFDMTYADKLFGPFQRLHRSADFSGSGIGLATVQRIVSRHGGQIWAKGKVGKGATFYFTLPNQTLP